MRAHLPATWAALLVLLTLACAPQRGVQAEARGAAQVARTAQATPPGQLRSIIRRGAIAVEVGDLERATDEVVRMAEAVGGRVESSLQTSDTVVSLTLRVPADQLDDFMDRTAALGRETRRSISATDVTEQVADLEAALENDRAFRSRLRELLDRAKTVEEVLKIETELNRLQTRIDQQEGRLERLRSQVEMSALSVELERRRLLGPLGVAFYAVRWIALKLFFLD